MTPGSVAPDTFTYRTANIEVTSLRYESGATGTFRFNLSALSGSTIPSDGLLGNDDFILHVGTKTFAINNPGTATSSTFSDHGLSWSVNDTVTVRFAKTTTPEVTISADKTSAVLKGDDITYTLTRTGPTTAALPVTVALTQTEDFLAAADLAQTVTIAAGQSTQTLTVAATSFQHFAPGRHGRGRNAYGGGAGRNGLRPGHAGLGRRVHSGGADDGPRDGVLLRCRGSRHAGSEAGGANGRGGVDAGRGHRSSRSVRRSWTRWRRG